MRHGFQIAPLPRAAISAPSSRRRSIAIEAVESDGNAKRIGNLRIHDIARRGHGIEQEYRIAALLCRGDERAEIFRVRLSAIRTDETRTDGDDTSSLLPAKMISTASLKVARLMASALMLRPLRQPSARLRLCDVDRLAEHRLQLRIAHQLEEAEEVGRNADRRFSGIGRISSFLRYAVRPIAPARQNLRGDDRDIARDREADAATPVARLSLQARAPRHLLEQ